MLYLELLAYGFVFLCLLPGSLRNRFQSVLARFVLTALAGWIAEDTASFFMAFTLCPALERKLDQVPLTWCWLAFSDSFGSRPERTIAIARPRFIPLAGAGIVLTDAWASKRWLYPPAPVPGAHHRLVRRSAHRTLRLGLFCLALLKILKKEKTRHSAPAISSFIGPPNGVHLFLPGRLVGIFPWLDLPIPPRRSSSRLGLVLDGGGPWPSTGPWVARWIR